MNLSIYLDETTAKRLRKVVANKGGSRNAVIRKAIQEYIERREHAGWPEEILRFQGVKNAPVFEATRRELSEPNPDPFAG